MMRIPNLLRVRALRLSAVLGVLTLGACDSMFTEPGAAPPATLAISYTPAAAEASRSGEAEAASVYAAVDHARVRLKDTATGAAVADTTVALDPEKTETRVRIAIGSEHAHSTIFVLLELLDDGVVVARGTSEVVPSSGSTTPVAVTTTVMVGSVVVTPASDSVRPGATRQLTAEVRDPAGNPIPGRTVSWTSSDPALATVSATGLVTGIAPGTVTITATSEGRSGQSTLRVLPPPESVGFQYADPTGDTYDVAGYFSWDVREIVGSYGRYNGGGEYLRLTFRFGHPVTDGTGDPDVHGYFELDSDENPATGALPFSNDYGGSASLGIDYILSLSLYTTSSGYATRLYRVVTADSLENAGSALATFGGDSITVTIPLASLGGDDGNFQYVAVVGNSTDATDVVPNAGSLTARRPASAVAPDPVHLASPVNLTSPASEPALVWKRDGSPPGRR